MSGKGFGRLVVTVYGILAFAAIGRSSYQVSTSAPHVPTAYWLSALAAVVYVVAAVAIAKGWRRPAWAAVLFEAVGVLSVGAASLASARLQHDGTVWRMFGADYGFVPLVLPFVGLWWLWRTRPSVSGVAATGAPSPSTPASTPESEA
ncbi:hypothetical protein [Xylanimonas allomyrinae]|uniref:hypothetical protein n=1 Tax=Xylanimonas allomyrinae TaxID=2509459 RepID=UPI001FEC146E|nr:hypothetical protein [Xylanimonas allomyrinae]